MSSTPKGSTMTQDEASKEAAIQFGMSAAHRGVPAGRIWFTFNEDGSLSMFHLSAPDPSKHPGKRIEEYAITRVDPEA